MRSEGDGGGGSPRPGPCAAARSPDSAVCRSVHAPGGRGAPAPRGRVHEAVHGPHADEELATAAARGGPVHRRARKVTGARRRACAPPEPPGQPVVDADVHVRLRVPREDVLQQEPEDPVAVGARVVRRDEVDVVGVEESVEAPFGEGGRTWSPPPPPPLAPLGRRRLARRQRLPSPDCLSGSGRGRSGGWPILPPAPRPRRAGRASLAGGGWGACLGSHSPGGQGARGG